MMKKITLIFMSLALVLSLAACGGNGSATTTAGGETTTGETTTAEVTATAQEIEQKIIDAIGSENYLCDTEIDSEGLVNYYGFDTEQIEDFVAKVNSISIYPDSVVILKVKDGYADTAVSILNESYKNQVEYSRIYPSNMAKVLNGRIYQSGNYVMYIVAGTMYEGDDSEEEAALVASDYAKIDEAIKSIFGTVPENKAVVPEESETTGGGLVFDEEETTTEG